MGMNDRTREDDVAAPPGQSVPPVCPARVRSPNPCSLARPASWLNLEKSETEVGAGDAGWPWRPTVRYCSFTDSREPANCREGAGETTLGMPQSPDPHTLCHFFPTTALRRAGRKMPELGYTPSCWA